MSPRPHLSYRIAKRGFDVTCAGTALVGLAPFMLGVGALVRLTSPGPAFFRQTRMGQDFRRFNILKFRTMVVDAPARGGQITAGEDPRITPLGRILRRTKIDELPQLINIVRGEMSFVGPRPEVPRYVELFRKDYETLLSVRPGITDPASLAYRHEQDLLANADDPDDVYVREVLPHKIRLARQYLASPSLRADIGIILRTAVSILSFSGESSPAPPSEPDRGQPS